MYTQIAVVVHVAAVLVVVAAAFIKAPWLRPVAVVLASVAICIPYLLLRGSLSYPSSNMVPGRYEMYASIQDPPSSTVYVMMAERGKNLPPRLFSLPMSGSKQSTGRDTSGRSNSIVDINIVDGGTPEMTGVEEEYELPDPDKEAYYQRLREGGNGQRPEQR